MEPRFEDHSVAFSSTEAAAQSGSGGRQPSFFDDLAIVIDEAGVDVLVADV